MNSRFPLLVAIGTLGLFVAAPAHLHGLPRAQHEHHADMPEAAAQAAAPAPQANMMAAMKASESKLDELVKKMNAATGAARTDAIADLLTALVEDHRAMHGAMMSNMASKMEMMHSMGGMRGRGDAAPTPPATSKP